MSKMPNYEQGKKEKYYKLRRQYEREVSKDRQYRSDQRVDDYADELLLFLKVFIKEIQ